MEKVWINCNIQPVTTGQQKNCIDSFGSHRCNHRLAL